MTGCCLGLGDRRRTDNDGEPRIGRDKKGPHGERLGRGGPPRPLPGAGREGRKWRRGLSRRLGLDRSSASPRRNREKAILLGAALLIFPTRVAAYRARSAGLEPATF